MSLSSFFLFFFNSFWALQRGDKQPAAAVSPCCELVGASASSALFWFRSWCRRYRRIYLATRPFKVHVAHLLFSPHSRRLLLLISAVIIHKERQKTFSIHTLADFNEAFQMFLGIDPFHPTKCRTSAQSSHRLQIRRCQVGGDLLCARCNSSYSSCVVRRRRMSQQSRASAGKSGHKPVIDEVPQGSKCVFKCTSSLWLTDRSTSRRGAFSRTPH